MATVAEAMQHITGWPRSIAWSEFRGTVPGTRDEEARIVADPALQIRPGRAEDRSIKVADLRVRVVVNESASWASPDHRTARLLRHEQGHYDIAGMGARDLTRAILDARAPTARALWTMLRQLEREAQAQVNRVNRLYDDETDHFRDAGEQARWERKISDAMQQGTLLEHL